jgi:hypothetical protein
MSDERITLTSTSNETSANRLPMRREGSESGWRSAMERRLEAVVVSTGFPESHRDDR